MNSKIDKNIKLKCQTCKHDCINQCDMIDDCSNYSEARLISEYNKIIKEENRNLHKFCRENGLKYSILIKYLEEKERMCFKYRQLLEKFIYEKNEWYNFNYDDFINSQKKDGVES